MAATAGIAEDRWEGLLDAIELGKVVPIVGRRLSLVQVDGAAPAALHKAAAERLALDLGIDPLPAGWGLSELDRVAKEKDAFDLDAFHPKLKRTIAGMTMLLAFLLTMAAALLALAQGDARSRRALRLGALVALVAGVTAWLWPLQWAAAGTLLLAGGVVLSVVHALLWPVRLLSALLFR